MIGKTILNYKILSLIGSGGMGSVYLAQHTQVDRKVAIKVLLPQFLENEEIKQRFKNEASTLAHLHHPKIVGLFDYFEDDSGMYLVMEYVEGKQLDDVIRYETGPMPEEKALNIITQILQAFSYAHHAGIVHRDIKPANILVTRDHSVKILDFGIARIVGDGNHNLTKTGTQIGTIFYMSPEQVQGKKADFRSDIYSLGVTFYQILTGLNPYEGLTTEYEVYSKIVKEDLPSPQDIYPGVPIYLSDILAKALHKNPDYRFQTCEDFLKALASKQVIQAEKYSKEPTVLENNVLDQSYPKENKKKSKALKIIAMILGAIVLIVIGMIVFKDSDGDGFIDINDSCKDERGTLKGCLDSDGDGVKDADDTCPLLEGSKKHKGCPDSDGDGVYDHEDNCPSESGLLEDAGCPKLDSDNDGVYDEEDECPEEPGDSYNNGCPETGEFMFWFNMTNAAYWPGNVTVYVSGVGKGIIQEAYYSEPDCGDFGCYTISLPPGTYFWSARSASGVEWDGGEFSVEVDECNWQALWTN
jgi:serine/threonine protein kinase